ncbi:MAG: hypothetical protein LBI06_02820 [Treponema sp.]|nr:hypothetical protein [Treponema sp.]
MEEEFIFKPSAFKHGIDEAEYWDEYYTENTIMPDMSQPGFFARKYGMMVRLDPETTQFLATQAETTHKSFAQIINELVKEKIAVSI